MSTLEKDLTADTRLKKRLGTLVVPIFIEVMLVMLLGGVDTFMLSRHSDNAVAAVGVVNQIINLAILIFQIINLGTSVLCSQYLGAKKPNKVVQVVGVSILINFAVGVAMSALLYFGAHGILQLMELKPELMPDGLAYMKVVGLFIFMQSLALTVSAALRSAGLAKFPMMVTVVMNILNIVGNYSLIFGHFGFPAMGVEGAAISTAFCRGVSMVLLFGIMLRVFIRKFPLKLFSPFPWAEVGKLLKIGVPSAGENLSYNLSQVVLTFFINALGVEALATRTYAINIILIANIFCIAMAQGGAILIGNLVGQQKPHAAYLMGRYVMKKSVFYNVIFSVALAAFGTIIFGFLSSNPDIVRMGAIVLAIDVVVEIGRPINIYATNALRAVGDVNYPFFVGVAAQWTIAVCVGYLFGTAWGLGIYGFWIANAIDENVRGIIFVRRWDSKKWIGKGFVKS